MQRAGVTPLLDARLQAGSGILGLPSPSCATVAEALNCSMPQFPSLKNEVITIKPSLESRGGQGVTLCSYYVFLGSPGEPAQVVIHPSTTHSFTPSSIQCPVPQALPSRGWGTFRGFFSALNAKPGASSPGPGRQ